MKSIRVMVTGAGSGVGQGIIKALRASVLPITVIAADIDNLNAALFRADESVLIPRVEIDGSLPLIIKLLREKKVDVLMIGSEFDLAFLAGHRERIQAETGVLVVAAPEQTVAIANDKWLTVEFLRSHGLPYALSHLPVGIDDSLAWAGEHGYPLILKTRTGTSNRHVHVVNNDGELAQLLPTVPRPMLQQLIDLPANNLKSEYTCSVFKCRDGLLLGPFTARRTLRGGNSWIVEVDAFSELHPLLLAIGENMPIMGSLNIQLMLGPKGPVPFEFNARFSGTTAVRAHFGFNEPEMVLRHYHLGQELSQPEIRRGMALRYLEEVFIDGVIADELGESLPRGEVRRWF